MSVSINADFITGGQNNDSRGTKSLVNLKQGKSTEGFDEYFDPPLENKYGCPICLLGLREPVQTECGHRFCRNCIVRSLRESGNKCPVDDVPLSESRIFDDNFAKREIGSSTVWCRQHKERGCPWKGTLNDLEAHLNTCPFKDVLCSNKCGLVLLKKDLREHLMNVCPKRKVECEHCKELILFTEMKNHFNDCPKYKRLNCERKINNEEEDPQDRSQIVSLNSLRNKVKLLENRLLDLEGRVTKEKFIWKIDNYEQCRTQAVSNAVPAIHSPPFYTDAHGYKMCLRIYLNGVGSGLGHHVSLFFHMMQGEWDDILEWPPTGRITLAILDQSENVEFRQPISKTLFDKPDFLAIKKPTAHCNQKEHGFKEFCQINQLVQDKFVKNDSIIVRFQIFD